MKSILRSKYPNDLFQYLSKLDIQKCPWNLMTKSSRFKMKPIVILLENSFVSQAFSLFVSYYLWRRYMLNILFGFRVFVVDILKRNILVKNDLFCSFVITNSLEFNTNVHTIIRTQLRPMFHFYTPLKCEKIRDFLMFSKCTEMKHWWNLLNNIFQYSSSYKFGILIFFYC